MKASDKQALRALSIEDLQAQSQSKREELFRGRVSQSVEGQGLGGKARVLRRDIARIETLITQKRAAAAAAQNGNQA